MPKMMSTEKFGKMARRLTMAVTGLATVVMLTVGFAGTAGASNQPDWWHEYRHEKCYGYTAAAWHNAGYNVIFGTNDAEETIIGTAGIDIIFGLDGIDYIYSGAETDVVCAGNGDDWVHGNDGDDYLFGEHGNDHLFGDFGSDQLKGGEGDDNLYAGYYVAINPDTYTANPEASDVNFGQDFERNYLYGENGNDKLHGDSGPDVLKGGYGEDSIYGLDGDDFMLGEHDRDWIFGGLGNDVMGGGHHDDLMLGQTGLRRNVWPGRGRRHVRRLRR